MVKPLEHQELILRELKNLNKGLVIIPSGAGKTHTAAFDVLQKNPNKIIYIVHRNEILDQTIKIFKEILKINDNEIGMINEKRKEFHKKYLFATIQTLSRDKNLSRLDSEIEYVIIDEFHHAAAMTYQKVIKYINPKYFIGLTATPDRTDLVDVKGILDNKIVGNVDILEGINRNILVPFHYIGLKDNIDYSDIKYNGYGYTIFDLDKKLLIDKRDIAVIEKYKNIIMSENRITIGFCNSIDHVNRMTDKFNKEGIKSIGITYKESFDDRKEILKNFRKGYYKVLFARDILNEGIDFPECDAIMFLRPTMSKIVFFQQLGRGLRKREGKKDVIVLDFIGNYHNAYKIKEYFKGIENHSYIFTGERIKPEYNYNIPIVEFEQSVIDLFMEQELRNNNVTKETLIEDYKNAIKIIGRNVRFEELEGKNILKYSKYHYARVFGSFGELYKAIGLNQYLKKKQSYCDDKQKLIDNFNKIWKKKGTEPTIKDIDTDPDSEYYSTAYQKTFGGIYNFKKFIGMNIKRYPPKLFDEEWVIESYKKLAKKLGRNWITETDWREEYDKKGQAIIYHKMGGFAGVRRLIGIEYFTKICEYCKKEFHITIGVDGGRNIRNSVKKRFCSQSCNHKSRYKDVYFLKRRLKNIEIQIKKFKNCEYCKKEIDYFSNFDISDPSKKFMPRRFCNKKCEYKLRYEQKKKST